MNEPASGDLMYEATQLLVAGEAAAALDYFVAAALARDVDGQLNTGFCYETGTGTRRSHSQALRWYRTAIKQGSGAAAFNLATMHRDRGNTRGAIHWFRRAIALGDDTAGLELGRLCLQSLRQRARALKFFNGALRGRLVSPSSLRELQRFVREIRAAS